MADNKVVFKSLPFYINGSEQPKKETPQPRSAIRFGAFFNNSMNLFVSGASPIETSNSVELFIKGSSAGFRYEFRKLDLFIIGRPFGLGLNLFIQGSDIFRPSSGILNLFVKGTGTPISKALDLVIWGSVNNYSLSLRQLSLEQYINLTLDELYSLPLDSDDIFNGYYTSKSLDLYIRGAGELDNALVYSTWMNLYLQGGVGSTKTLNLFINGSPVSGKALDLYAYGVTGYMSDTIDLYMFSIDPVQNNLNLFVRGYI